MSSLGIYVQVPFCQTKCTYCNFHTGVVSSGRFAPYIDAVVREIASHKALCDAAGISLPAAASGWRADTVYIGGGTPSLLEAELLRRLLTEIRAIFLCDPGEITLEADPETIDGEKAASWAEAGINRISLGLQSFSDRELAAAGRLHRRDDIRKAVPALRAAGFRNISFDLIAGLPFQTEESWQQSLEQLLQLDPGHVSVYLLEIDEGSRLGKQVLQGGAKYSARELPAEEQMAEFYEQAQQTLSRAGYHHYEISNWAKPGLESRHNLKYWRRQPYLGFGAGAHSFSGTERWANAHDPAAYVQSISQGKLPVGEIEKVSADRALEEELFLGLRQLDGIDVARIEKQYGVPLAPRFEPLLSAGLVERSGSFVKLAPARLSVSNEVFVELLR